MYASNAVINIKDPQLHEKLFKVIWVHLLLKILYAQNVKDFVRTGLKINIFDTGSTF